MSKKKRYPIRIPRYAAGIRAQEPRSGCGRAWWAMRWRKILESMGLGARLGRGKNYALSGQVVKLEIEGSHVEASVVGTRPDPYRVTIDFRVADEKVRARIAGRIRAEPMLAARLAADDLPMEVEVFFREEGAQLFPGGKISKGVYDMATACNCPDYANPCKHASAVLTLLGEEIARHPLTLLALRGIAAEEIYDED